MRLTLRAMAQIGLIWRLNTFFKFFCNVIDSNGTMMDEAMVSRHTSPLLLQAIFFMMQNVNILSKTILPNRGIQHKMRQQNSPTTK